MTHLSQKQVDTLQAITAYHKNHGFAPTVRELALHLGVSVHTADFHLRALTRKGAIQRTHGIARGIVIPQADM